MTLSFNCKRKEPPSLTPERLSSCYEQYQQKKLSCNCQIADGAKIDRKAKIGKYYF